MISVQIITGELDPGSYQEFNFSAEDDRNYLVAFCLTYKDAIENQNYLHLLIDSGAELAELSDERLKILAASIVYNTRNDPKYAKMLVDATRLKELSAKWSQLAAFSNHGNGLTASQKASSLYETRLDEARNLIATADNQADRLLGMAKYAKAAGKLLGRIGLILPVAEGAWSGIPDEAAKGFFGVLAGGLVADFVLGAFGGIAVVAALPIEAAVGAIAIVVAAGFLAGAFVESIWDMGVGSGFWSAMDYIGAKDALNEAFTYASQKLHMWFPTSDDPEGEESKVVWVSTGTAIASDEKNIVYGNSGANEIDMLHGRTVAFGGGGDDIYRVFTTAKGNQVITDADGNNKLYFGVENIADLDFEKTGEGVFRSSSGNYTIVLVSSGDGTSMVVSSKYYDVTVTVLNWVNGSFGISLPGEVTAPEPGIPLGTQDDLFGNGSTNTGNDAISALERVMNFEG